ncbi:MAG: DUF3604 domain-containing protein [Propionibacteriaceae bacterium]|nr:DUF3604 domain-containing protein [Propionibacteriaceae bacterium]
MCKEAGVDPFASDCATQAAAAGADFANCCLNETNDPVLSPTIQERAWTSPIWYRQEGIAEVTGGISFGGGSRNGDALQLAIRLAAPPPGIDLAATPATVAVTDDDAIFTTTIAPANYRFGADGALRIDVEASGLTLDAADRVDHTVTVDVTIGTYRASYARRWRYADRRLAPAGS